MIPHLLSILIFLPLAGALLLLLLRANERLVKAAGLAVSLAVFLLSLPLYFAFDANGAGMQFEERIPWIGAFNASYHVGIDGVSLLLILLTTFLTPVVLLSSWD